MGLFTAIASFAVPAVTSLLSGNKQAKAAKRAAATEAAGAAQAREDLDPFRAAGVNALGASEELLGLSGDPGNALAALSASPGFQFRFGQGVDAVERGAAARGGLFGGNTGRALTEFGQNFASNEFANRLNQLGLLAGRGQNAAAGTGAASLTGAGATAGGIRGAADARTSGIIGFGNALTGGLKNSFITNALGGGGSRFLGRGVSPTGGDVFGTPF